MKKTLSNTAGAISPFHVKHFRYAVLALTLAVLLSSCRVGVSPITGRQRLYAYSWEQERQIGEQVDHQIQRAFGDYDDAALAAYVTRVGNEVLEESHMRRPETPREFRETPFHFRVLDSPIVNAFALPGGYVYVTRGLLAHMNNEAQLAMVLGHEVTHVAARHASQRALEQQLGQLVLLGGAIAGQELLNIPARNILDVGGFAAQLLFLRYSRDDEREADERGVEYAALANFDAAEGAAFFRTLQRIGEQAGQAIPNWLATHPDPGEREQAIERMAAQWREEVPMDRVAQRALYDALSGMVLGENPRQGFTEGGVYYHPDLRFQFPVPSGFQLFNQPSQVQMVEANQQAFQVFQISQQATARAAATELARQQGIEVVDSGPTQSSGLPAFYVLADARTEQGQIVRLLSYYVEHGDRVYQFIGYSLRDNFSRFEPEFQRSMRGFAPVTDPQILNVEPTRLRIVPAPRSARFETFLPTTLPRGLSREDLAIMNQVALGTQIPEGTLLKLP